MGLARAKRTDKADDCAGKKQFAQSPSQLHRAFKIGDTKGTGTFFEITRRIHELGTSKKGAPFYLFSRSVL
jgi:hypothetical protein